MVTTTGMARVLVMRYGDGHAPGGDAVRVAAAAEMSTY